MTDPTGPEDDEEEPYLSEEEEGEVQEHRSLSPVTVYSVVAAEGREEIERPVSALWWSGIAAGLGISTSVLGMGILHGMLEGHPQQAIIERLGYPLGFILVILSRLQLFTENTITAILPLLKKPSRRMWWKTSRLWVIVFVANMVGTLVTAFLTIHLGIAPPDHVAGMLAVSRHFAELGPMECMTRGIPAGFFIAALVWMLPSSRGFEIFTIFVFTYLIAMGEFTHVVAGSTEAFLLLVNGDIGIADTLSLILPTFVGNVLGGTGLFALLAYGQVREEIEAKTAEHAQESEQAVWRRPM